MAMNVSFKKGVKASLPATRDANTFYYVSDEFALYLGDHLISNEVSLEMYNALAARVKTLEDWKAALPKYVTKAAYDEHITTQAAVDKKQTDDIAQLRSDLDDITEMGGEPNKVDDVKVNGTSVVTDKIANIDLTSYAKSADVVSNSTYNAHLTTQSQKDAAQDGAIQAAQADATTAKTKIEAFLGAITPEGSSEAIDTLAEIQKYMTDDTAAFTQLSEKVTKIENGTTVVAKANADKDGNEISATYAKTASLGDLATKDSLTAGEVGAYTKAEVDSAISTATTDMATNASVNGKLEDYAKTADISADIAKGVAAKEVTDTLKSAAFADTTDFDAKDTAKNLIGSQQTETSAATGVYAAIQGATTNTVKDCVDAINALNAGTAQANKDINAISTSVNDVVSQLTWGSF